MGWEGLECRSSDSSQSALYPCIKLSENKFNKQYIKIFEVYILIFLVIWMNLPSSPKLCDLTWSNALGNLM